MESRILMRPDMDTQKGQRPIDVQTVAVAELAADRLAVPEKRVKVRFGLHQWRCGLDKLGLHRMARSADSRMGSVDARAARSWSIAAQSGSPLHSSMKIFLNSTAMAQPVSGKLAWTKRVCSPLPWKDTFSRTSIGSPFRWWPRSVSVNASTIG